MKSGRILIAQNPKGSRLTEEALRGFELVFAADIRQAEYQIIEDGIDLFLLGIHFDDSRAIELVSSIRKQKKHKQTPIVLLRFLPTSMADSLRATLDALVKTGTVNQYLEVEGDPDAVEKIRLTVTGLLPDEKLGYLG